MRAYSVKPPEYIFLNYCLSFFTSIIKDRVAGNILRWFSNHAKFDRNDIKLIKRGTRKKLLTVYNYYLQYEIEHQ